MSIIHVFISLKITDNTARSALYALHQRMGMPHISQLKRWDVWELELDGGQDAAENCVRDWVENTALFMNPNKHHYKIHTVDCPILDAAQPPEFRHSTGSIFVYDREDGHGEAVMHTLQSMLKPPLSLKRLLHGVWWDITVNQSNVNLKNTLDSLALTTHRTSGLFANPHYQNAKVYLFNRN